MRSNTFKSLLFIALAGLYTSCSSDDDSASLTGEGQVSIEFDNGMAGDDLILHTSAYTNGNNETLTIDRLNYIVSNFTLTDDRGNTFVYPKDDSYFVISEESEKTEITLTGIPAGNYTKLQFGIGVDQEKYLQGAEGQGNFLEEAEQEEMMWSWQAGYKFLNFEGTFISSTVTEPAEFKIHMGSHGSSLDNYREVTLNLSTQAIVSEEMNPLIHLSVDADKILNGSDKMLLSEEPVIMISEEKSPKIAENATEMFSVDHVHNGSGNHH
ncbi:MbnP family protein [Sinomicrobium sp. M5D2P9]